MEIKGCGKELGYVLDDNEHPAALYPGNYRPLEYRAGQPWVCGEGRWGRYIVLCNLCAKKAGLIW